MTNLVQIAKGSDTANEPGSAEWWWASHTTTGAQNVAYNAAATGSNIHVVAVTLRGDASLYVQGSGTKGENTVSFSVSLTTGYISGLALGAFYGGGAEPASLTFAADRTTIHEWDFGAFYSEVFRNAAVTAQGTSYMLGFGADASSDDVGFAAVYITDGVDAVGTPQTANIPVILLGSALRVQTFLGNHIQIPKRNFKL